MRNRNPILLTAIISIITLLLVHCTTPHAYSDLQNNGNKPATPVESTPPWVSMNGPFGGRILEIAVDPVDPNRLWAAGPPKGLYYSENRGLTWDLLPFPEPHHSGIIRTDLVKPGIL